MRDLDALNVDSSLEQSPCTCYQRSRPIESLNARLRDEFLNGEIFYTLQEAKVRIEAWRRQYNTVRPHSSLGYRPPAPEVLLWPPPPAALKGAAPATAKPAQPPCN